MKSPLPYALSLAVLLIAACAGPLEDHAEAHDHGNGATHENGEADQEQSPAQSGIPEVVLNNGQRWVANPETTEGVMKMSALLAKHDPSTGDPEILKAGLEEEFALIFERCTMTGEAHEQLHNYLLPLHQRLNKTDFKDKSELGELQAYLGTYGNYFD